MRDDIPPSKSDLPPSHSVSPSWIPLGIFLLVMLFTPLGRIWALCVLVIGGLIYAKRLKLQPGLLWAGVAFAGGVLNAGSWSSTTLAPNFRDEPGDEQALPAKFKRLEVRGSNGFVRVFARPGVSRVRFERKGGATVTMEQRGDTVIITAHKPFFSFSNGVNITLEVPENLEGDVQTSNGFIEWQGRAAKLQLRTSNDRIALRDAGNVNARLETSNDDVTLERVTGAMYVRSSNGAIRVADSNVALDAQTDNATITLERVALQNNTKSRAFTSNGGINVSGLTASSGLLVRGGTSNARVDVNAPGFNVKLDDANFEARRDGFGMAELELRTSNDRITMRP
jgi:hypothetical protein